MHTRISIHYISFESIIICIIYSNIQYPEHFSFVIGESPQGPVSVSIVRDDPTDGYKAVIRTSGGNVRTSIPKANVKPTWWRKIVGVGPSANDIQFIFISSLLENV